MCSSQRIVLCIHMATTIYALIELWLCMFGHACTNQEKERIKLVTLLLCSDFNGSLFGVAVGIVGVLMNSKGG